MSRQRALYAYIGGIGIIAATIFVASLVRASERPSLHTQTLLLTCVLFVALSWICSQQNAYLNDSSSVTLGSIGQVATMLILPVENAVIVIGVAKVLSETRLLMIGQRRSWRAPVVNASGSILSTLGGMLAFQLVPGHQALWHQNFDPILAFPALIALGAAYHIIETAIVAAAITLTSAERLSAIFSLLGREALLPELSLIIVGIVFAVLWEFRPVLSIFIVVPVYFSLRSFESEARLRKETIEAVLKMAESIDYRDTGTYEHSKRLAELTRSLALALGLAPEHVAETVLASRVHDLGKIGISNDILLKPASLTTDERQIMQDHPVIGANILASYSAFKGSVDMVKHHHERWDGRGYPNGLKGDEIPIGSRIITVVDSFDSMTADRPYRRGLSVDDAVARLKDGMGTQFDPRVCAEFIQLLIEQGIYTPIESAPPDLRIVRRDAG
ncbi:MAG TPA: HD-GYP domain-containing protein [Chloroflexota bacterium]